MANNLPDAPWAGDNALPDAPWKPVAAPKPEVSQGRAALEGALSGASANMRDEVYGASKASGLPDWLGGFRAPVGAARLAYEHFMGEPGEASKEYERARDEMRAVQKRAKELYPGTTLAGEIGGALALPGGAMVQAATLPGRIARGAAVGAGYGGLSGFGEGEGLGDSLTRGAVSAPVGAAVGAAAAPIVEGAARAIQPVAQRVGNAVRGAVDPEAEAARRSVMAIERDIQADPQAAARLTPQEFVAARNEGTPVSVMDMGGDLTRRLADVSGIASPEGRTALNAAINNRFESQSERVGDWLTQRFGPSDTGATREALQDAARQANRPAYSRAYREGDRSLWSPELERLASSPDVVSAMRDAAQRGKSRAVVDGFGGFNPGVTVSDTGVVTFQKGANGVPTYPNLQFWDYTKRALDDAANAARRSGRNDEASVLGRLATSLRGELDNLVPSYQSARAGAARFFGANDALEAGERFLTANTPLPEARRAFAAMNPAEQDLFREGFVQSLTQKIERTGDRRSILNAIATSPRQQQQIEMVLGPQRAREFEAMMRVEGVMDMARSAVQGNSWTARRLYDLGLAGGGLETLHGGLNQSPGEMTMGALVAALASGGRHVDQRVATRVARMLASDDPAVLARGVRAVANSQNFLNSLRHTDARITMAGSQHTPTVPLPTGTSPVGAQPEQQQ